MTTLPAGHEQGSDVVGFIGYGAMGVVLGERLRAAGISPVMVDSSPVAAELARQHGYEVVDSCVALAARCNLIEVLVRSDDEVEAVMLGPEGVLGAAQPGTVVLLHSTIRPETARAMAEAARSFDIVVLDAPIVGAPPSVTAGTAIFLVGGDATTAQRVDAHLRIMGADVLHMGPVGTGSLAKLLKNLITGADRLIIHEALQLAEASGMNYVDALEMLRTTFRDHVPSINRWEQTFDPSGADSTPNFSGLHMYDKDIPLVAELARDLGVHVPITDQLARAGLRLTHHHDQ